MTGVSFWDRREEEAVEVVASENLKQTMTMQIEIDRHASREDSQRVYGLLIHEGPDKAASVVNLEDLYSIACFETDKDLL